MGIFAADRGDNSPENTTEDILKQLNKEKKSMWTKLWQFFGYFGDPCCLFSPSASASLTHAQALQVVFTRGLRQMVHSIKFNNYLLNTYSMLMSEE